MHGMILISLLAFFPRSHGDLTSANHHLVDMQHPTDNSIDDLSDKLAGRALRGGSPHEDFDRTTLGKVQNDMAVPQQLQAQPGLAAFSQNLRTKLEQHSAFLGKLPENQDLTKSFSARVGHFSKDLRKQLTYPRHVEQEYSNAKTNLRAVTAFVAFANAERTAAATGSYSRGPPAPEAKAALTGLDLWRQAMGLKAVKAGIKAATARTAAREQAQKAAVGAASKAVKTWAAAGIKMALITKYIESLADA
eukprot:gnl/TRDRNA2_/TRDRNA2_196637_c0_seq1.p1 gnl/TRDRNA2_/TRDRNA2_196637_c0~~gnl/TRDRNA2_/TRDRNA2_196637_c0_seq1.p1  ORF type:complete len:249 (+),score=53.68 gnl/TRDRNA2_/TRDRNA2_196637_c0_seq1:108-854(+)